MAKAEGDVPLTPRAGEYASGDAAKGNKRARTVHYAVGGFFLVNIIVLYILHFADRGSSSSSGGSSGVVAGAFQSDGLSALSATAQRDRVVSFGPDGKLRVGAGTSVYLNAAALPEGKQLSALRMAPLGTSQPLYNGGLVAWQQGAAAEVESVVSTFVGDVTAKTVAIAPVDGKNAIKGESLKGLITLSDARAVVLTSLLSGGGFVATPFVTPATIKDGKVELQTGAKVQLAENSATTFLTRLTDASFATVFYEPYDAEKPYNQRVMIGAVAADSGKTTFSKSVAFAVPNSADSSTTVGQPQRVFASGDRFTVPWFVDAAIGSNATLAPTRQGLCLSTFGYDAKAGNLSQVDESCATAYAPVYFVDAARLSDTRLALMFVDRNNRYALTIVTVEFSEITGKPTFRGAYTFDEASGEFDFGAAFGFYPQPTLQVLSNQRVAVAFMNPSNKGKPSVQVLKFASDLSLTPQSPVLPIANADFSLTTADPKAGGGIVVSVLPLQTGFVTGFAGLWSGKQHQRVSFAESFGRPVGVVTDVDGGELSVSMSGTVEFEDAAFQAGSAYFAATDGKVYQPSTATDDAYVLANDNTVVISKDALVGVAISGDKLFVSPQAL